MFPVLNMGAELLVIFTVSVTGTVSPGVNVTLGALKEAEDPELVQETLPAVVQVQLPGRWAEDNFTFPEKVLLALTLR